MHNIFKKTLVTSGVILALTLPACTVLDKVQNKSSEKVAELIVKYCNETNEVFRARLRERINLKMIGQATIAIECFGR